MATIGKYRRARLIDGGYQVRTPDQRWLNVTGALHFTAPLRVTVLHIEDEPDSVHAADDEIFSRTPGEIRRAAEREAARS